MSTQKIGGLIILLLGIPLGLLASDRMLLSGYASIGLMLVFFAKEHLNDERVQQLKQRAMFAAMSSGLAVTLLVQHYAFVLLRGTLDSVPPTLSAWEFLAGVLLIALGLYHYWHWRDGRADRDAS